MGTVPHMPPELLVEGLLTKAGDVWAFGILMWWVHQLMWQAVHCLPSCGAWSRRLPCATAPFWHLVQQESGMPCTLSSLMAHPSSGWCLQGTVHQQQSLGRHEVGSIPLTHARLI